MRAGHRQQPAGDYAPPAGEGVLAVGKALGLTPSFGEVVQALFEKELRPEEESPFWTAKSTC